MGFAFSQKTWHEIIQCASYFCNYDDYNWDWSLQHVSQQCLKDKLKAMVLKGPRVFHIGEWYVINVMPLTLSLDSYCCSDY